MRRCPRCQDHYDDDARFCARDGATLESLTTPDEARVGQVLIGQFELREVIGRGAMGTVYKAWQRGVDREVAVKFLRSDLVRDASVVKRFMREAQSVARLQHPNIVSVIMIGQADDGVPYLVMEYVHGTPMSSLVAQGTRLPPARLLRIARQIASALADAHAAGVIHRDLKPANILLTERRRQSDFVKVVDFGIAKLVDQETGAPAAGQSALTRTGTMFGTPHYVAPEQAQGLPVDGRADLYSLGVIMFALATGQVPFDGTGMAVVVQHVNKAPPRPRDLAPEVAPGLEKLILQLLEKDRARRPENAEVLIAEIEALWRELGLMGELVPRVQTEPPVAAPTADPGAMTIRADSRLLSVPPVAPPAAAPVVAAGELALAAGGHGPRTPSRQVIVQGQQAVSVSGPTAAAAPLPSRSWPAPVTGPPPSAPPLLSGQQAATPAPRAGSARPMLEAAETMPPSAAGTPPTRPGTASQPLQYAPVPAGYVRPVVADQTPIPVPPPPGAPSATSEVFPMPGNGRRVAILVVLLLLLGGGAFAAVWAYRTSQGKGAPSPQASSPAPATTPVAEPPTPPTPPAPRPGAGRVVTLGEDGWAVRVELPEAPALLAGHELSVPISIWDPRGKPLTASAIRVSAADDKGIRRDLEAKADGAPGRYLLVASFTAGAHEIRIFPGGKVAVWFTLEVQKDAGASPEPQPTKAPVETEPGDGEGKAPADVLRKPSGGGGGKKRPAGTREDTLKALQNLARPDPPTDQLTAPPPNLPPLPPPPPREGPAPPPGDRDGETLQ